MSIATFKLLKNIEVKGDVSNPSTYLSVGDLERFRRGNVKWGF